MRFVAGKAKICIAALDSAPRRCDFPISKKPERMTMRNIVIATAIAIIPAAAALAGDYGPAKPPAVVVDPYVKVEEAGWSR
jgi:hypothetical protein